MITGIVIRDNDAIENEQTELERFDLMYTLRQVKGDWQIIVGALYDSKFAAPGQASGD